MKVKSDLAWAEQESELKSADESSLKFLDFLRLWVDTAEEVQSGNKEISPRDALSEGFKLAEQSLGFLSVEWLSQMLLVIIQHWSHGDDVWESLSAWERRMVEQATALKMAELQLLAEDPPETETDS